MGRRAIRTLLLEIRARLWRDERGIVLVETALLMPALLVMAFGVVSTGRVVQAQLTVQAAAREAGRELASAPSLAQGLLVAEARAQAILADGGLDPARSELRLEPGAWERGGTAAAEARYQVPLGDLPLFGSIQVTVSSRHEERVELYRSRWGTSP